MVNTTDKYYQTRPEFEPALFITEAQNSQALNHVATGSPMIYKMLNSLQNIY